MLLRHVMKEQSTIQEATNVPRSEGRQVNLQLLSSLSAPSPFNFKGTNKKDNRQDMLLRHVMKELSAIQEATDKHVITSRSLYCGQHTR